MRNRVLSRAIALSAAASILAGWLAPSAPAAPITTLFNTGVDNNNVVLADNAVDPHYRAVAPPPPFDAPGVPAGNMSGASTFAGAGVVARASGGFPIPPWVPDTGLSAWTTPAADTNGPGGNYAWETVFDLNGFIPATAVINGRWSSDNGGLDILVNGASTGQANASQFGGYSGFVIPPNLLLPTTNVLTFIVNNGAGEATEAGPTGVRVEFDQRDAQLIPEPSAAALLLALAPAALARRRQRGAGAP